MAKCEISISGRNNLAITPSMNRNFHACPYLPVCSGNANPIGSSRKFTIENTVVQASTFWSWTIRFALLPHPFRSVAPQSRYHDLVSRHRHCVPLVWIGYIIPAVIVGVWFGYAEKVHTQKLWASYIQFFFPIFSFLQKVSFGRIIR